MSRLVDGVGRCGCGDGLALCDEQAEPFGVGVSVRRAIQVVNAAVIVLQVAELEVPVAENAQISVHWEGRDDFLQLHDQARVAVVVAVFVIVGVENAHASIIFRVFRFDRPPL